MNLLNECKINTFSLDITAKYYGNLFNKSSLQVAYILQFILFESLLIHKHPLELILFQKAPSPNCFQIPEIFYEDKNCSTSADI